MLELRELITVFKLEEIQDERYEYEAIRRLAAMMKPGTYTTAQIFMGLRRKFIKVTDTEEQWNRKANKWLDLLVYYDFLIFKEGEYETNKCGLTELRL